MGRGCADVECLIRPLCLLVAGLGCRQSEVRADKGEGAVQDRWAVQDRSVGPRVPDSTLVLTGERGSFVIDAGQPEEYICTHMLWVRVGRLGGARGKREHHMIEIGSERQSKGGQCLYKYS